jgi:hypothetical protein
MELRSREAAAEYGSCSQTHLRTSTTALVLVASIVMYMDESFFFFKRVHAGSMHACKTN